jgi:glycosyltransferase involved in cell wall biosynthesis
MRVAERVLVLNETQARELRAMFPRLRTIERISNMLDVGAFPTGRAPGRPTTAVFLSRVSRDKGAEDVLHAVALLRQQGVPLQVVFAGDGEIAQLREVARRLELENQVTFVGFVDGDRKRQLLADADLFLLPSHLQEGLPYALLEAMAAGLPIVATGQGGIPDIIESGENGVLVAPGAPEQLAGAIRTLLSDAELAARMGQANRRKAETHFDLAHVSRDYERVYAAALKSDQA